jgi:hypothetical protein
MRHRAPSHATPLATLRTWTSQGRAAAAVGALAVTLAGCGAGSAIVGIHHPPAQITTTAPITTQSARQIATRVMTDVQRADAAPAAQAKPLRALAMTGTALAAANAASELGGADGGTSQALTRTEPPKVLAISRGTSWPRVILVQSTNAEGAAVLNLLSSPDARTPFKLSARATMHPGASVAALDSLVKGSPLVTDDSTLTPAPQELLKGYAASLAYPKPVAAKGVDGSDPFSMSVRANAAAQAKAFGKLATLTQTHQVQPAATVAIGLRGGGAVVFAVMERVDTVTLRPGGKSLKPSPEFQRLVGKKTLSKSAQLKTYETVVLTVSPQGAATVVAADEALFSAKGA